MFTSFNSLAFFCGVGAFYAYQTDQQSLFLGFIAAVIGLLILGNQDEIQYRNRRETEDDIYRRIDECEKNLTNDIREVARSCDK